MNKKTNKKKQSQNIQILDPTHPVRLNPLGPIQPNPTVYSLFNYVKVNNLVCVMGCEIVN